ncbi:MAG: hypothetical protein ACJ8H8_24100 [Geminicoccaceae bacterium]
MLEYACLGQLNDPATGRVRVVDLGGLEHVRRTGRPGVFVAPISPGADGRLAPALGCGFLEVAKAAHGMRREAAAGAQCRALDGPAQ